MKHLYTRIGLGDHYLSRKVKVYDVEKKELIAEFDSMNEAAKFTGVKSVREYINKKSRSYKNKLGKVICFR